MIDRKPISRLQVIIGTMSALSSPERYWLYKLVENVVLYDGLIETTASLQDVEDDLTILVDEWYEIQRTIRDRFDPSTVASLNARCIPAYRMYKVSKRGAKSEQTESESESDGPAETDC